MNKMQKGFTLIELMIVVAIIGILAAIGLPAYQDYITKSNAAAALQEMTGVKTQTEIIVSEGKTPTLLRTSAGFVGVTSSSATYCNFVLTYDSTAAGTTKLRCDLKNVSPAIRGKSLSQNRINATGAWQCGAVGLATKFKPKNCV